MSLTKTLFGIASDIEVQPEITENFVRMGLKGLDEFRKYLCELGYSDNKFEEILLEIYREVKRKVNNGSEELLAIVCSELGGSYLSTDPPKAEKFLLESFNLRNKLYFNPDKAHELAYTMNRLGILYSQNRQYKKSELMFEDHYTILKELYYKYGIHEKDYAIAANNLGNLYLDMDRLNDALRYFFEALEHKSVLNDVSTLVYYNIALTYEYMKEPRRSANFYFKAACSEFRYNKRYIDIIDVLSKAYEMSENPDIYAFYIGYMVTKRLMGVDTAKKELKGLKFDIGQWIADELQKENLDYDELSKYLLIASFMVAGERGGGNVYHVSKGKMRLVHQGGTGLDWLRTLRVMRILNGNEPHEMQDWLDRNLQDWVEVRRRIIGSNIDFKEVPELRDWLKSYIDLGVADLSELDRILQSGEK